jgi:hypothetical protein
VISQYVQVQAASESEFIQLMGYAMYYYDGQRGMKNSPNEFIQ